MTPISSAHKCRREKKWAMTNWLGWPCVYNLLDGREYVDQQLSCGFLPHYQITKAMLCGRAAHKCPSQLHKALYVLTAVDKGLFKHCIFIYVCTVWCVHLIDSKRLLTFRIKNPPFSVLIWGLFSSTVGFLSCFLYTLFNLWLPPTLLWLWQCLWYFF